VCRRVPQIGGVPSVHRVEAYILDGRTSLGLRSLRRPKSHPRARASRKPAGMESLDVSPGLRKTSSLIQHSTYHHDQLREMFNRPPSTKPAENGTTLGRFEDSGRIARYRLSRAGRDDRGSLNGKTEKRRTQGEGAV
jgi:hypothetical protein